MVAIMKKLYWLLLIPLLLCGCSNDMNRKEIDEINFIHALGIDYSNGEYILTALYNGGGGVDPESSKGAPAQEEISSGTGKTPYEAYENLALKNKKAITLTQAGFYLIGDSAAKAGIDDSMDFLSRSETIKMESQVYVTKGVQASDFINAGIQNKQTVHEDLEAIKQKQGEIIKKTDNNLVNILNEMKQSYSSVLIPYLVSDKNSFLIGGYAVFDDLKLKDYLDYETSSGVNFIRNIVRAFPIYIDGRAGLSVFYAQTTLKTELDNEIITVKIRVNFETMIVEVAGNENIFTPEELSKLTKEQNDYVQGIMDKAVNYSVSTGLDILQLARLVENQHVSGWKDIKKNWTKDIPNIRYEYDVKSKIVKSFLLGKNTESAEPESKHDTDRTGQCKIVHAKPVDERLRRSRPAQWTV